MGVRLICLFVGFASCGAASADRPAVDFYAGINDLRSAQCAGVSSSNSQQALVPSAELETAALLRAKGLSLTDAMTESSGEFSAASILVVGGDAKTALGRLASRYCDKLSDPDYSHVGAVYAKERWWIVLGSQVPPGRPIGDAPAVPAQGIEGSSESVLARINAARNLSRECGGQRYQAAPALVWNTKLAEAATRHARDMSVRRYFAHVSPEGQTMADRVSATGYRYRNLGENIAAMPSSDADRVVESWLNSAGHCANIMNRQFTEIGAAVFAPSGDRVAYWVLVLGASQ